MSFRTDVRAGVMTSLTAYKTANPGLLNSVRSARPASLTVTDLPVAWLDAINATAIRFAQGNQGIRQTELEAIVTLAMPVTDARESVARMDTLVDGLLEQLTTDFHSASGYAITEPQAYTERLVDEGAVPYLAVDYSLRAYIAEGRQ